MKTGLYLVLLICFALPAFAQVSYTKETQAEIKAVENGLSGRIKIIGKPNYNIYARMKYYKVKGLSVAVVHNYKVVWAKGYGWADEAKKRPVTTETLFEPGSISKSLNAMAVLKLVQDKKLDLYTDINTYLTSWKFPYDSVSGGKKITLAQILSHSAGLTVHGFPGYDLSEKMPTIQQVLNGEPPANSPPVRSAMAPGGKYEYSGGGTMISQLIVEEATGQPYDEYIYENVLKPMGMTKSFFTQPPAKEKQALCATGYYPDGTAVAHKFHKYPEQAAAGLWTTPTDLCKYIIETQLAYEGKSAKVLSKELTRLRLTPYNDKNSALGVFIEQRGSANYFTHNAGNEGFSGHYYGSLEGGDGIVIFTNSEYSELYSELANSVATVYKWKDFYRPEYRKEVKVPERTLQKYAGIYLYDNTWASILKRVDGWYLFSDGIYSKMHFTSADSFFNMEFLAEKQFVTNPGGVITGYNRTARGKALPPATRIVSPDTLRLDKLVLNEIGWHLLENKRPAEAIHYLEKALKANAGDLMTLGNLAHAYLFTSDYSKAIGIYKAHMNEIVTDNVTWQDAIKQDFKFFKRNGQDSKEMDKVFAELGIEKPDGY